MPLASMIATGLGVGKLPLAPGTWASLFALPVGCAIAYGAGWPVLLLITIVLTALGVWAADTHAKRTGIIDPSECVIDEIAAQFMPLVVLGASGRLLSVAALIASFVAFRFFDIAKPWPIAPLERLPGGWGVMADDVAAGLAAAGVVAAMIWAGWL
jgi:phosphatidylglycerophosphatase A